MSTITLQPVPISEERFAPFGDVIAASAQSRQPMNDARFERFDDLASVDVGDNTGSAAISIARCRQATRLPYLFDLVERHPLGSQAFVPRSHFCFIVVVGPAGESIQADDLQAFVTNGSQGVNYHKGVWHMPLIAFEAGQEFIVVDRAPGEPNCEEFVLGEPVSLQAP